MYLAFEFLFDNLLGAINNKIFVLYALVSATIGLPALNFGDVFGTTFVLLHLSMF